MPLQLPTDKRLAVNISVDFDAHCMFNGHREHLSPAILSRGDFDVEVGTPRLLALFGKHDVPTTWCVPGHTLVTSPHRIGDIVAGGHEIAAHGAYHENVPSLSESEERRLMDVQLAQHEQIVGQRPRGYRSPAWDFSDATLGILDEYGFDWDSSLMGREFQPYRPRPITTHREQPNEFGAPSRFLELPVSWQLDDFPAMEHVPGLQSGLMSTEGIYARWKDTFDYAYENEPDGCLVLTLHGLVSGRAYAITMLERFIEHVAGHDGAWFATLSQITDAWRD